MRGFFKYWRRVLVLAFRHSLDHTQTVIFILFLAVGMASYFLPRAVTWESIVSGWHAATFVLGGIVLVRLLLAPFWLDQEREKELSSLRARSVNPDDLSTWTALDPLPLDQIAFLWCGKAPRGSVLKAESCVRLQYEKLRRDVLKENLHPDWDDAAKALFKLQQSYKLGSPDKWATEKTPISILELKRYAQSVGEHPTFLFPVVQTPALPKMDISTGSGTPYELVEMIGERRKSVVKIGIRNAGDGIASNCAVLIERLAPKLVHERAYPIKLNVPEFTLRHDDPEKFVEIAEYWTHLGKIRLNEPQGTTFTGPLSYFDAGIRYSLVVKIRAAECSRSAMFDMWVDPSNQLRLSYAGDCE